MEFYDLQKPARRGTPKQPPAKTAFKHTIEKKEDRTLRSFALIYIFVIERRYTAENVYNYMLSI